MSFIMATLSIFSDLPTASTKVERTASRD